MSGVVERSMIRDEGRGPRRIRDERKRRWCHQSDT